jgi:hypothetical protein
MALRLRGATSGYIELKAPASAGDNTLTLPTNNGSANQLLKTDGSGNLSWVDDNSGVSLSGSTNNTIATVTGANALIGEANLTFDGTKLTVSGGSNTTQAVFSGTGGSGARGLEIVTESVGAADEGVIFNARASGTTGRLKFNTNGATAMTILGNGGNVGIGRTDPGHKLAILGGANSQLEIKGTEADFWLTSTGSGSDKAWRILGSTGGNTHRFRIYDNANGKEPFYIIGSNGSNTQHVHVNSGDLVFDASGTGISFAATGDGAGTDTSETLNDYEEGTWSPIFTDDGASGNSASSYGVQLGWYTKIGNLVNVQMRISNAVFSSFNTSHATYVKGLPYVIQQSSNRLTTGTALVSNCNLDSDTMSIGIIANTSTGSGNSWFRLFQVKDNTVWVSIKISQWTSGDNEIIANFSYRTDAV